MASSSASSSSPLSSRAEPLRPLLDRKGIDGLSEVGADEIWETFKILVMAIWSKTTRRMRVLGALLIFM